jgi:hypothetical protein
LDVKVALASDDDVGVIDGIVKAYLVSHKIEAWLNDTSECDQTTRKPACGTRTRDVGNIDAEVVLVHLDEPLKSASKKIDLGWCRSFLRAEDASCVNECRRHIACDAKIHPVESTG